jgi:hypothetical protein
LSLSTELLLLCYATTESSLRYEIINRIVIATHRIAWNHRYATAEQPNRRRAVNQIVIVKLSFFPNRIAALQQNQIAVVSSTKSPSCRQPNRRHQIVVFSSLPTESQHRYATAEPNRRRAVNQIVVIKLSFFPRYPQNRIAHRYATTEHATAEPNRRVFNQIVVVNIKPSIKSSSSSLSLLPSSLEPHLPTWWYHRNQLRLILIKQ